MADYGSTTDDWKCLFCEIVSWNIKTPWIFWEDDEFMAFLSTWPNTEWFTVLIPKNHYGSDCLSMPDDMLQNYIIAAKRVSNILLSYFVDVGRVGLIMEWTWVDHAHIKLVPMHWTWHMKQGVWKQYLSGRSDYFEKYLWYIISTDWPRADTEKLKALASELRKNNIL